MRYVHIAGTNGKGSAAEYISGIFTASGRKCGCFTSPHLISPCERMRVGSRPVSAKELDDIMREVKEKGLAVNDTLFAAYTASALLWFEREGAEIAVMETGLGGAKDPTNQITPDIIVLTSIDYDHTELLGGTLSDIAGEKCGIIKPFVPVVSANQKREAKRVIISQCREKGSPLEFTEGVRVTSKSLEGQAFLFKGTKYNIKSIGESQPYNAALAVLAAKKTGVGEADIKTGLENTKLECRTQYIKANPDMLLDGAHNPAAVNMLIKTIKISFPLREKILLFACMKDKDYRAMINSLDGLFSDIIVTRAQTDRSESPELLAALFKKSSCVIEQDTEYAYAAAKRTAERKDALLVVCGSFYLAGNVLKLYENL